MLWSQDWWTCRDVVSCKLCTIRADKHRANWFNILLSYLPSWCHSQEATESNGVGSQMKSRTRWRWDRSIQSIQMRTWIEFQHTVERLICLRSSSEWKSELQSPHWVQKFVYLKHVCDSEARCRWSCPDLVGSTPERVWQFDSTWEAALAPWRVTICGQPSATASWRDWEWSFPEVWNQWASSSLWTSKKNVPCI